MTHRLPAVLLVAALAHAGRGDELVLLAGQRTTGAVAKVDAQAVAFKDAAGTVATHPLKEVSVVDFGKPVANPPAGTKYDEIELTDGTVLRGTALKIAGKTLTVTPLTGNAISVPLGAVSVVVRNADDPKSGTDLKKLLAARSKRDLFVVRTADGLNPLLGTVIEGNEAGDAVTFELEDGTRRPLKLSRATGGLIFNQPPRDVIPPTVCKVLDTAGNVLMATAVEAGDTGLTVKTVSGATVTYPAGGVSKLDFAQGNVAYLVDLEPAVQAPEASVEQPRVPYLRNTKWGGASLRMGGQPCDRALWVAPDTTLTYKLGGGYREFKATLGFDDAVPVGNGAVKVSIEADGRVLFAGTVQRKDKPKPLTLDVTTVNELKLSVEPVGLFLGNELTLHEPRVQK